MKAYHFLSFLMLVAALLGCAQGLNLDDKQLQDKLVEANSAVRTYSMDMDMEMKSTMDILGQKQVIEQVMASTGEFDKDSRQMRMQADITTQSSGMDMSMDMTMYLIDDTMYTETMGRWVKTKLDSGMWSQQDQLSNYIQIIRTGDIKFEGTQAIGGDSYYVVSVKPDIGTLGELLASQQSGSAPLADSADISEMIDSYDVRLWINRDTFIMEKSRISMEMSLSSEMFGGEQNSGDMLMESVVELKISNINEPVNIVLPEEAEYAVSSEDIEDISFDDLNIPDGMPVPEQ